MNNIENLKPFKRLCMTIGNLPTAYIESMSYYECITYLVKYLTNEVIPTVNNNSEVVKELQNYVEHYFDNLDVQEEINNKLDEMAESGELSDIIAQYLGLAGVLAYNTVSDMKAAENLADGSTARTLGYYSLNDGGDAIYKVREITNNDVVDEATIISLYDNNLIAELINKEIYLEQFGCYGDGTHDDTTVIQNAIDYCTSNNLVLKSKGDKTFLISQPLSIIDRVDIDLNGSTITTNSAIDMIVFNYPSGNKNQGYLKNVVLDMNEIATTGIHAVRLVKKLISNIEIKNVTDTAYQIDLGNEVIFENSHFYGIGNSSIGLRLIKGDCHYKDIIMIDIHNPIYSSSTNFYTRIHAWIKTTSLIPNSIFMKCDSVSTHFLSQCYSDTYATAFYVSAEARLKLTEHYNYNNENIMTEASISEAGGYIYGFYYTDSSYSRYTTISNSKLTGYSNTSLAKFSNVSNENLNMIIDGLTYSANWNANYKCINNNITADMITGTTVDLGTGYANKIIASGNVVELNLRVDANSFISSSTTTLIGVLPSKFRPITETVFIVPISPTTYGLKNQALAYILTDGTIYIVSPNDINTNDRIFINKTFITDNIQP